MKKILVTGGSGFVGTNLVCTLVEQNYLMGDEFEIISTGSHPIKRCDGVRYLGRSLHGINWSEIGEIDICVHMGANNDTTCHDEKDMFESNVLAGQVLFCRLADAGCKQFVYASSTAVYGNVDVPFREDGPTNPLNAYGRSKLEFDNWIQREHGDVNAIGLRFCNIYGQLEAYKGRRASMVTQLSKQIGFGGNPVLYKNGEQARDYIYVKDVVGAIIKAMDHQGSGVFNCAGGESVTFNRLTELILRALGVEREIEYIDNPHEGKYQNNTLCDISKMRDVLKYTPQYDISSGIEDYLSK